MSDKTLRQALDDWEKEANKFIEESKKVGVSASKELQKQLKKLQDDGTKLMESIKPEAKVDDKLRTEMEKRYDTIKDKLTRALDELKK